MHVLQWGIIPPGPDSPRVEGSLLLGPGSELVHVASFHADKIVSRPQVTVQRACAVAQGFYRKASDSPTWLLFLLSLLHVSCLRYFEVGMTALPGQHVTLLLLE